MQGSRQKGRLQNNKREINRTGVWNVACRSYDCLSRHRRNSHFDFRHVATLQSRRRFLGTAGRCSSATQPSAFACSSQHDQVNPSGNDARFSSVSIGPWMSSSWSPKKCSSVSRSPSMSKNEIEGQPFIFAPKLNKENTPGWNRHSPCSLCVFTSKSSSQF